MMEPVVTVGGSEQRRPGLTKPDEAGNSETIRACAPSGLSASGARGIGDRPADGSVVVPAGYSPAGCSGAVNDQCVWMMRHSPPRR